MWMRKVMVILILGIFVLGVFAVADARNRPYRERPVDLPKGPGNDPPEADPWGDIDSRNKDDGGRGFIMINSIFGPPANINLEDKEEVLFKTKRGR